MISDHGHTHSAGHGTADHPNHGHTHGVVDHSILKTRRGLLAVKWSFIGLIITALFQVVIVTLSHSVALLADTIHNLGDAATAIPLAIAFSLARRAPTKRFPYGFGRFEDLAGVAVVLTILVSAAVAGYEAVDRFFRPVQVTHLGAVVAASIIGFIGNEGVALLRIRVGKDINSAALVADGYHARVDGWTSLAVLLGAVGVWLGYPIADPVVGIGITVAILFIVWQSGKIVFIRMMDGVEPGILEEIVHSARHVDGVRDVGEARARWIGHQLHVEINISVGSRHSVAEGHEIASEVRHRLMHNLTQPGNVMVHIDPDDRAGELHHRVIEHSHDGLPPHSH